MRSLIIFVLLPFFASAQLSSHSRGLAMGDAGIAVAHGQQELGYNVGKTVFGHHFHQSSVTYLPWMRQLFQDTKFIRADYLAMAGASTAVGLAINYLDLGNLTTRDNDGASLAIYRNVLYNVGGSVGVRLSEHAGIGSTIRFIGARGFDGGGPINHTGVSGDIQFFQSLGNFSVGVVVNQLGSQLWQSSEMGVGFGYNHQDEVNSIMVGMDIRKPFKGALKYSLGAELGFEESFFLRSGLSLEQRDHGNRKYFSLGAGYKGFVEDQSWGIDLHYIIPFAYRTVIAPMQNAYGLSLYLNLGNFQ
jgi:hypothetical protein